MTVLVVEVQRNRSSVLHLDDVKQSLFLELYYLVSEAAVLSTHGF